MTKAKPIEVTEELRQLIAAKTSTGPSCWEWQGTLSRGYGKLWMGGSKGRWIPAHRASYIIHVGPVSTDMVMDHLCRNTSCVNPEHLEPVPQRVNLLRGESPMAKAVRSARCKRGHPRGPGLLTQTGQCRRCASDLRMEHRREREAADPALREARLEQVRESGRARRANRRAA